ncbi:MAG: hypothetical protein LUC41_00155 [Clostridiales bacterium]|nr:hypothetical protein [Clostridiales bacterium]
MFYAKDHPFLIPKDTGIPSDEFTFEQMKALSADLSETEKKCPHAKYYYELPAPLPQEHLDAMEAGPIDPSEAFEIWDYGNYMNKIGHCAVENGYCVLPSGIAYSAARVIQEGRFDDMTAYYNQYFAPEECLFYKTWYPGNHYMHFTDGAVEDFGFGRQFIKFTGLVEVEDLRLNYDDIDKNDPACISINGSKAVFHDLTDDSAKDIKGILVFYHRLTENGREMRMRMWNGISVDENGEYVIDPLPADKALKVAKCCMCHLMQEYTNDHYLETKFWYDNH